MYIYIYICVCISYIYIHIHIYIYIYKSLELLGELEELGGERRESSELGPGKLGLLHLIHDIRVLHGLLHI